MAEVIHRSEMLNVSFSSSVSVQSIRSPVSPEPSIGPIELGTSFTADELDEKRENRRVYDYLCRLAEVRNWFVEILKDPNVPTEVELESNLSNGVLLARLANAFAPDVVPVSIIFDYDQSRYKKEGQPCYRHTDNINSWRKAVRTLRFPEILLPATVDVYGGRNIRTIFCLYALAIHLFRLRRGPPIRSLAGNVEFSENVMDDMRERLKDSTIPIFSEVSVILKETMNSEDADVLAMIELNKSIDSKEALLEILQKPETGVLFVNQRLIGEYQKELQEYKRKNAGSDGTLEREAVQRLINTVNEADALRRLDVLITEKDDFSVNEMATILDDLQQEGVIHEHALPVYAKLLREARISQQEPLSVDQLRHVIEIVDTCMRIKILVIKEDSKGLYDALTSPALECKDSLREDLQAVYLEHLKAEYSSTDKNHIVLADRIQAIVREANEITAEQRTIRKIRHACANGDKQELSEALIGFDCYKQELTPCYLLTLGSSSFLSLADVEDVLKRTNISAQHTAEKVREAVRINKLVFDRKLDEAQKCIISSFSEYAEKQYTVDYRIVLEEELLTRRRKFLKEENESREIISGEKVEDVFAGYVPGKFNGGELYVNAVTNEIVFERPTQVIKWMLRVEDIEEIMRKENERIERIKKAEEEDLAERQRREEAAIKIQRWLKRLQFRRDLNALRNSDAPSLRVVRMFVRLLLSNQDDVERDTEIEDNKSKLTALINANGHLEEQLRELDNKIALLVKNRINLQEVIEQGNKVNKEKDEAFSRKISVRKKDREQWNAFEMIIFHLQTEPLYLSKIIAEYKGNHEVLRDFFKGALLPMFNFAAEEREEFLLVSLLRFVIKSEVESLKKPEDLRKSFAVILARLLLQLSAERNVLKPKLAELRRQLEEKENQIVEFNLNPAKIYEEIYERPLTNENEAASDEKVRNVLESSKNFTAKWSLKFAEATFDKSTPLPRILRFLINALYMDMREKFPKVTHNELIQGIAGWLFKSCWEEQIAAVKEKEKSEEEKDKRKMICKFLEYGAIGLGYGEDKKYLMSLNETIAKINENAIRLLTPMVVEEVEFYQRDKYSDMLSKHKPILHISLPQLNVLHRHLKENIGHMIPNNQSELRQLIESTPTPPADQQVFVTLVLHPMLPKDPNKLINDPKEVFQRAKRGIVECLLCDCPGENVTKLLEQKTTEEQEHKYKLLHPEQEVCSLTEQKEHIRNDLDSLHTVGMVSEVNNYQAIITAIARDINREQEYRNERRQQLQHLRATVTRLAEQRKEYYDQLNTYREYLDKCLDNMSLTSRRPSIRPNSTKAGKIMKQRESLDAIQRVKCSAEKLIRKGILLSVDGCDNSKEIKKMSMEISTTERPGILLFVVNLAKKETEKCEIDFQELLRADDNEEPSLKVVNRVNLDVQKLIAFINKKFYSQ